MELGYGQPSHHIFLILSYPLHYIITVAPSITMPQIQLDDHLVDAAPILRRLEQVGVESVAKRPSDTFFPDNLGFPQLNIVPSIHHTGISRKYH